MSHFGIRGGHTETSSGASGYINELREDRMIYPMVINHLKEVGNTVTDLTPPESYAYPAELSYGINKANNEGIDFGASIHFNSGGGKGCEVWVHDNAKESTKEVARRICSNLESLGFNNRGLKYSPSGRTLGEIVNTNMSFIIVEVCFVDSSIDKAVWDGLSYASIARAIANGFDTRVSLSGGSSSSETTSSETTAADDLKPGESLGEVIPSVGARVREGAGTNYSEAGPALACGTKVRIGFSQKGDDELTWHNIYYGDHGAWIRGDLIKITYTKEAPTEQQRPSVMYRVIMDGTQMEALSNYDTAVNEVKTLVSNGDYKSGKVQRNTDGLDLFKFPEEALNPSSDVIWYRIFVDEVKVEVDRDLENSKKLLIKYIDNDNKGTSGYIERHTDGAKLFEYKKQEPSKNVVDKDNKTTVEKIKTPIMGNNVLTKEQMAKFLFENNKDPKLTISPEELISYFLAEGTIEGVRGDIAFCQAIKETGFFRYGNQVLPEQNNYAGIGATNNSPIGKGAWFKSASEGVRAQIQHLKAYASKDNLSNECIDPRFNLVTRGIAENWEDLNGKWAVPGENYGEDILSIFNQIQKINIENALNKNINDEVKVDSELQKESTSFIQALIKFISMIIKKLL